MDIESVTVNLTAAQILTLDAAPVQLLPAPGAHTMLLPMAIIADYKFGTTPFQGVDGGGSLNVFWQGTDNYILTCNDPFWNTTASQICPGFSTKTVTDVPTNFANRGLFVQGGNYSGGNGTAKVTLFYLKVSL